MKTRFLRIQLFDKQIEGETIDLGFKDGAENGLDNEFLEEI
jgi:hypothetical protein